MSCRVCQANNTSATAAAAYPPRRRRYHKLSSVGAELRIVSGIVSRVSFVFISYSRSDFAYVQQLAAFLSGYGVRVWYDVESLSTGDRWENVIKEHVETCSSMVVVMSPDSGESSWVRNEVNLALSLRKPIFPLLLAGEPFFSLGHIQLRDVRGGRLPGEDFAAMVREGRVPQGAGGTTPVRRPYFFDGITFFDPAALVERMEERWDLALDQVAGGQTDALEAWLADEVRDNMLPTNILRFGTADERIARLSAHFRADHPPVFRSQRLDMRGLVDLARKTWAGDTTAAATYGAITTGLLEIFASHRDCAALRTVASTMRSALDDLSNALGGQRPAPGLRIDLLPILSTPRGGSDTLRLSGGLLAALYDDSFIPILQAEITQFAAVPRSDGSNQLAQLLPTLPSMAQRAGLFVSALAARADAEAEARRQQGEAEAERRRIQAEAEAEARRQADAEARASQARAAAEAEAARRRKAAADADARRRWQEERRAQERSAAKRRRVRLILRNVMVLAGALLVLWGGTRVVSMFRSDGDPVTSPTQDPALLRVMSGNYSLVSWSPDGEILATAADMNVDLWDPATGTKLRTLIGDLGGGGSNRVVSIAWSSDKRIAVGFRSGGSIVWAADTGAELYRLGPEHGWPERTAWSPNGQLAGIDGTRVDVWNGSNGGELNRHHDCEGCFIPKECLFWSPDGQLLAALGNSNILVWDVDSYYPKHALSTNLRTVESCSISSAGFVVAISQSEHVELWDLAAGTQLAAFTVAEGGGEINAISLSPDGGRVVTARGALEIRDAHSGDVLRSMAGSSKAITSVAWSPDGSRIASASADGARIWAAPTA